MEPDLHAGRQLQIEGSGIMFYDRRFVSASVEPDIVDPTPHMLHWCTPREAETRFDSVQPYTPHPAPYNLQPAPYTLNLTT